MTGLLRLLRDHGDAVEADLAFQGIDLRDHYRPGAGLTLRRLFLLIQRLPSDTSWTWALIELDKQKALRPTADKIRERQEFYARKRAEAKEAAT